MADKKRRVDVFSMGRGDSYAGSRKSDMSPSEMTSALAETNQFDLSYLSDNARGNLAPGQARLLISHLIGPGIIVLVSLGFLGYQLYQQGFIKRLSMGTPFGDLFSSMPQGLLIIGGVLLAVGLISIFVLVRTLLDMFGGTVASLEGTGWKKITRSTDDDGSTTTRTYYVIADQRFSVSSRGFAALENGRNYRVYFTPRRKILVNIEALD